METSKGPWLQHLPTRGTRLLPIIHQPVATWFARVSMFERPSLAHHPFFPHLPFAEAWGASRGSAWLWPARHHTVSTVLVASAAPVVDFIGAGGRDLHVADDRMPRYDNNWENYVRHAARSCWHGAIPDRGIVGPETASRRGPGRGATNDAVRSLRLGHTTLPHIPPCSSGVANRLEAPNRGTVRKRRRAPHKTGAGGQSHKHSRGCEDWPLMHGSPLTALDAFVILSRSAYGDEGCVGIEVPGERLQSRGAVYRVMGERANVLGSAVSLLSRWRSVVLGDAYHQILTWEHGEMQRHGWLLPATRVTSGQGGLEALSEPRRGLCCFGPK
jgi:hypothetical protein